MTYDELISALEALPKEELNYHHSYRMEKNFDDGEVVDVIFIYFKSEDGKQELTHTTAVSKVLLDTTTLTPGQLAQSLRRKCRFLSPATEYIRQTISPEGGSNDGR